MRHILISITTLLLGCICYAQEDQVTVVYTKHEIVSPKSSTASTRNSFINYTIGQPVVGAMTGSEYSLQQGFQQPNIITSLMEHGLGLRTELKLYPNPGTDFCIMQLNEPIEEPLYLRLTAINGQQLSEQRMATGIDRMIINLESYVRGTYILSLLNQKSQLLAQYKIVKISD